MNKDAVLQVIDEVFEYELSLYSMDLEGFKEQYGATPLRDTPFDDSAVDIMIAIEDRLEVTLPEDDEEIILGMSYVDIREKVCLWLKL